MGGTDAIITNVKEPGTPPGTWWTLSECEALSLLSAFPGPQFPQSENGSKRDLDLLSEIPSNSDGPKPWPTLLKLLCPSCFLSPSVLL